MCCLHDFDMAHNDDVVFELRVKLLERPLKVLERPVQVRRC